MKIISSLLYAFVLSFIANIPFTSSEKLPFTLGVRDSIMIAHSFRNNPAFGPAQHMVREYDIAYHL